MGRHNGSCSIYTATAKVGVSIEEDEIEEKGWAMVVMGRKWGGGGGCWDGEEVVCDGRDGEDVASYAAAQEVIHQSIQRHQLHGVQLIRPSCWRFLMKHAGRTGRQSWWPSIARLEDALHVAETALPIYAAAYVAAYTAHVPALDTPAATAAAAAAVTATAALWHIAEAGAIVSAVVVFYKHNKIVQPQVV